MSGKQSKFLRSIQASKAFKKKYRSWPHHVRGAYRNMILIDPFSVQMPQKLRESLNHMLRSAAT